MQAVKSSLALSQRIIPGTPTPQRDPHMISMYSAFIMEGMHDKDYDAVLTAWNGGCVELLWEVMTFVPTCSTPSTRLPAHAATIWRIPACRNTKWPRRLASGLPRPSPQQVRCRPQTPAAPGSMMRSSSFLPVIKMRSGRRRSRRLSQPMLRPALRQAINHTARFHS